MQVTKRLRWRSMRSRVPVWSGDVFPRRSGCLLPWQPTTKQVQRPIYAIFHVVQHATLLVLP
jgi:hypothetical protein